MSKTIWVDDQIKWNVLRKRALCKFNQYKGHAYVVCTSPHEHLLFEIVEARFLSHHYAESTVLALCNSRQQAFLQVTQLVDALYNQQTITYSDL